MRRTGPRAVAGVWLLVALALGGCGSNPGAAATGAIIQTISPTEAADLLAEAPEGLVILDVRPSVDFAAARLAGAINLDASAPDFATALPDLERGVPYLLYCWTGETSAAVREMMRDLGFAEVYEIAGGIAAWGRAGLPIAVP